MTRPPEFVVERHDSGSEITVSVAGELDLNSADRLGRYIAEQLPNGVSTLVLDLRELTFIDSSGLRFLIELHNRSQQQSWQLQLLAPRHEAAADVLRMTGADWALPFEADGER
jgi:anti-anti-sigma factor